MGQREALEPPTDVPKTTATQNESNMTASAVLDERSGPMTRSKLYEAQILYAIRQAEAGIPAGDLCRQLGVSDATFSAWKAKHAPRA